ncbi:MAG: serine hydrolase domain-containing protein [Bacteroidales bacterium]|nr:serine hydrolase domain-containing protein [Bacteroidales bacterium]
MKNLKLSGIAARLTAFAILSLFVLSCSKENIIIVPGKSDYNNITSFSFDKKDNPSLTEDCTSYMSGNILYISVPPGASLSSLKPAIAVSPNATIKINGTAVTGSLPTFDFTNIVKVVVTSESGKNREYKILAQTGRKELDRMVYAFMDKFSIPGISFAISKNEQIVYKTGAGFAILVDDTRTKPNHLFRLASISKQFTTLCIMKLLEQGKLTVESTVFGAGGLLESEFPNNITARAAKVTVRNLLEHNSGWTSNPDPMFTTSFKGQTLDQRITYVLNSTQNEPGSAYSYFNMGFGILGKIIEKLSGKSYEQYLKEVMALAGVTNVHVGGDQTQRRPDEVVYYSQDGTNGYGNEMQVIAAAGGVIASTEEMLKLLFHIDGLTSVPDIISPATRTLMLTPSAAYNRYALGWRTNHSFFPGSYYHGGNLAGTGVIWVMGQGVNAVVLCNSRSYKTGFDDELYALIKDLISTATAMNF